MSVETLKQYRETTFQENYVPQVQLVTKGEDGVTRIAKSNPLTGALVVDAVIEDQSQAALDVLKTTIVAEMNNQVEINFKSAPGAGLITNTFTGGGAVAHTNGHALYSTGTAVTASAVGVSVLKTDYRPAHEIYAYFTAAFTTPTSASSHQRIGLFDAQNGFFIGYEGTTFGITKRSGGVDTFVARSAFSSDKLDGLAGSMFQRDGAAEAINLSFSNLFRIRFAWLGSASILFEVFSPDAKWVTFHVIKQPNSALDPSIQDPNLPMAVSVSKSSADATNLILATACWAAGTTSALDNVTATITDNTLAQLTRSVITGQTTAGGGGYVNVKVNPSGALTAEVEGTVSVDNFPATQAVTGPLTDTQLRASAVPVSVAGVATAANQTTGNASLASLDSKTPELDSSKQPVIPSMTSAGHLSVTTAATGTNWTAFSSQACKQLTVSNQSGVVIEFRHGGAGAGFQVPSGAFYTFFGLTNASQLEARRVDQSNTQVIVTARWEV